MWNQNTACYFGKNLEKKNLLGQWIFGQQVNWYAAFGHMMDK